MNGASQGQAVKWPYNTGRWRRLRAVKLSHDPLCYACLLRGRTVAADTVDHMTPVRAGGDPFPALDELMSLCASCHSHKTQLADRAWRETFGRRFGGCDLDGNPIDPLDVWHSGGRGGAEKNVVPQIPRVEKTVDLFSWSEGF